MTDWLVDGPASAPATVVLAHGAGAAMDSPFMADMATGIGNADFRVVRFEFPYMARRRADGRKRPPDGQKVLLERFRECVAAVRERWSAAVVVGGKSLGGRMAAMLADELQAHALLVFGYPFHPPGKPERVRLEPLAALTVPGLILQGERDPFGRREELAGYDLPARLQVAYLPDGDHSFAPRKASGYTETGNRERAVTAAVGFLAQQVPAAAG